MPLLAPCLPAVLFRAVGLAAALATFLPSSAFGRVDTVKEHLYDLVFLGFWSPPGTEPKAETALKTEGVKQFSFLIMATPNQTWDWRWRQIPIPDSLDIRSIRLATDGTKLFGLKCPHGNCTNEGVVYDLTSHPIS
jgi:hypothetical protein